MDKILAFLNKFGTLILIVLGLLIWVSTCNTNSSVDKTNRRIDKVEKVLLKQDSTLSMKVSEKSLQKEMDIFQLEVSKNILYDWNSVVRQVTRPDDRMKYYDDKIKELKNVK